MWKFTTLHFLEIFEKIELKELKRVYYHLGQKYTLELCITHCVYRRIIYNTGPLTSSQKFLTSRLLMIQLWNCYFTIR